MDSCIVFGEFGSSIYEYIYMLYSSINQISKLLFSMNTIYNSLMFSKVFRIP